MNAFHYLALSAFLLAGLQAPGKTVESDFNRGWKFSLQADSTRLHPDFNDSSWRQLTLPHDWSIELPFDRDAAPGNDGGYLPGGTGWYRKTLTIKALQPGKEYLLHLGGAYMKSDVYVNGHKAGGNEYGYSPYYADITPYLKNGVNTIAVKVDNSAQKNCRWYSGSGLYRDVKLIERDPVRISYEGVYVATPDLTTANIEVSVDNVTPEPKKLTVTAEIDGRSSSETVEIPADTREYKVRQTLSLPGVKPWSPDSPDLYDARITLAENGKEIDSRNLRIGFRTIEWDADSGFRLNSKKLLLNGGCVHHDNGILGAAAFRDAERRRVRLLKQAGFNAVRTSHNIPSADFLDACDEYGLLVIDEAFDGWRDAKNDHDYHEQFDRNWQKDIDAMVLRDRNHPSVFCWSIGNEVIERKKIEVVTTARKLAERCRELDPGRPVTSALASWDSDWEIYDPLAAEHDIVGYNYMIHKSESDHERVPSRVMMQTESYPADAWQNYRKAADNPYIIGDFVWTAMDYIGESGIGRHYYEGDVPGEHFSRPLYPWHASYCGDIDLTGFRKPVSHYRSMLWNSGGEGIYIGVREPDGYKGKVRTTMWSTWPTFHSWNWEGHEGKPIDVEVYSRFPRVRLKLNNKEIATKETEKQMAVFSVPYTPGTLLAEGLDDNGNIMESQTLSTAGAPAAIRLTAEKSTMPASDQSLEFITVEIVDHEGRVVPVADNAIKADVKGPATLQALGNADIKDCDPYFDNTHKAWRGRALAIIRGNGKKGDIKVRITSPGLPSSTLLLKAR